MIATIIEQLAAYSSRDVFNPWADYDRLDAESGKYAPANRRTRLEWHYDCEARYLLVGEAPGYQGAHFSGVPFTNERLLLDGSVPRVPWSSRITTRKLPWCEPSATIVWRTLHKLGIADTTVMANAFSWHPHDPGHQHTNRRPTRAEVDAGADVLRRIVEHFRGAKVVAVGRLAEHTLQRLGVACGAVRHPSMGGAKAFAVGLSEIVGSDRKEVAAIWEKVTS